MDVQYDLKKNIPDTLNAINNAYDIKQITYYENQLACMLFSPIMFIGALARFINSLYRDATLRTDFFINMIVFLILGISFEFLRRAKIEVSISTKILTGLFVFVFLFIYIRLYSSIGPAVWTVAAIQLIFAMSRIQRNMAYVIGLVTIAACINTVFNINDYEFEMTLYYLLPQTVLLILLLHILNVTQRINTNRYENLYKKYLMVNEQKREITSLYKELIASEEELRDNYNQLADYNKRFIEREQKLHSLSYYDSLTGLPNRTMFLEHLEQTIDISSRKSKPFYLAVYDVNSFRKLNNTFGYQAGDRYLLFITEQIKQQLKEEDILSRIDGDAFALLIRRDINTISARWEIEQIRRCFSSPFQVEHTCLSLSASYGVAAFPDQGRNATEILKAAELALYESQQSLKGNESISFE